MRAIFAAIAVSFAPIVPISSVSASEFSAPWEDAASAIVLDPFSGNSINWDQLGTDARVVGIIHKASQGTAEDGKYVVRRTQARGRRYLWGSYHLLTTAALDQQIDNYIGVVGVYSDETYAIDVECLQASTTCQSSAFKVSFPQIEGALRLVRARTGRLPMVYANHSVAKALSQRWAGSAEFARVPLWYARFKRTVTDFPAGPWLTYALWQFSSEINCTAAACPYQVPGVARDMDLNVFAGSADALRRQWPLND
ncbi:MAG TPA: glycoside hydrolase family 25 protein [Caulobacteraceae bacterium]|jgi:GH25 family lysozyme M1 (1,4-beta-N-acetylmuramidase)